MRAVLPMVVVWLGLVPGVAAEPDNSDISAAMRARERRQNGVANNAPTQRDCPGNQVLWQRNPDFAHCAKTCGLHRGCSAREECVVGTAPYLDEDGRALAYADVIDIVNAELERLETGTTPELPPGEDIPVELSPDELHGPPWADVYPEGLCDPYFGEDAETLSAD